MSLNNLHFKFYLNKLTLNTFRLFLTLFGGSVLNIVYPEVQQ